MMKRNLRWLAIGIGIGIVLSVATAYVCGPRGSQTQMNLYTGETWTTHHLLWHTWRTSDPVGAHTKWALAHVRAGRTYWPVFVCAQQRGWFTGTMCADGIARDIVREICELSAPEERKIELLHEFHEDIGHIVAVDDKAPYMTLYKTWDGKLKDKP